jgi:hypothetical protein
VGGKDSAHQYAGSSAPYAAFDEITRDVVEQNLFYAVLQARQPLHSDHRLGFRRPVQSQFPIALTPNTCVRTQGIADVHRFEKKPCT